jgi:hypothetical protein
MLSDTLDLVDEVEHDAPAVVVDVLDGATLRSTQSIGVGNGPGNIYSLAVNLSTNEMFLVDYDNDSIWIIDKVGNANSSVTPSVTATTTSVAAVTPPLPTASPTASSTPSPSGTSENTSTQTPTNSPTGTPKSLMALSPRSYWPNVGSPCLNSTGCDSGW